jgi:DNA-binding transcriptional MerR regulator
MELILSYLLVAGLAFWLGLKLHTVWMHIVIEEILKDLGIRDSDIKQLIDRYEQADHAELINRHDPKHTDESDDHLESIEIKIEQHGDQLYAFRLDTDQFLGQGVDRESLINRLSEKMVNVRLVISEENGADLIKQ